MPFRSSCSREKSRVGEVCHVHGQWLFMGSGGAGAPPVAVISERKFPSSLKELVFSFLLPVHQHVKVKGSALFNVGLRT